MDAFTIGGWVVTAAVGILGGTGGLFFWLKGRGENKNRSDELKVDGAIKLSKAQQEVQDALDKRVTVAMADYETKLTNLQLEMHDMDARYTSKLGATARVMAAIARQAPPDFQPRLNPDDIILINDIVPFIWQGKPEKLQE